MVGNSTVRIPNGRHDIFLDETYLDKEIFIFRHHNALLMYAGHYQYDFEFQFPYKLPQSTEIKKNETYNAISYYCKAILDVPWKFNKNCRQDFTLKRFDDLNQFPLVQTPILKKIVKKFYGCFICRPGKLLIEVSLSQSGFAVGEVIPLKIKYDNRSNVKVEHTQISLEQWKVMAANRKKLIEKKILSKECALGVDRNCSTEFITNIQIPKNACISDLLWSESIKIKHFLKIVSSVEGLHLNSTVIIPIIIGTDALSDKAIVKYDKIDHPELVKLKKLLLNFYQLKFLFIFSENI